MVLAVVFSHCLVFLLKVAFTISPAAFLYSVCSNFLLVGSAGKLGSCVFRNRVGSDL